MKRLGLNEFLTRSKKLHGSKYDYSKCEYKNIKTKIKIVCSIHGEFLQVPEKHLLGRGCKFCGIIFRANNLRKPLHKFIEEAKNIHDNKYDYSKVDYVGNHRKVEIICKKHGSFWVTPNLHLRGKEGCPKCIHRISKNEIEFLNHLKIPNTVKCRQVYISNKQVDGYDEASSTIYEFLGDYYHGNPLIYDRKKYNPTCNKTYGKLYNLTLDKFRKLKKEGYNVKYIWESDWKKFRKGIDTFPNILEFVDEK